ncbi:MAG: HD domain-containing phosphohydrolase [Rhodoferax sp.]|jgi:HD-GYP domain-containing protein (c-di-GMP phosphodiesterase class II)
MKNSDDGVEMVDSGSLRIGMFVELDVGWLAHPFPVGSFKISSTKQIETLRGLGQQQFRINTAKSDSNSTEAAATSAKPAPGAVANARTLAAHREAQLRQQGNDLLAAQQRSLVACERRFGDAVRQYKKVMEAIPTQPKSAAEHCHTMVSDFVGDMLCDGDSAIRLLSEAAGDKSSMHPVNVTVVSLLLGKAMGLPKADLIDLGMAAFLHDVGKTQLPDRVRWLEDNFSSAEYKLYQDHVAKSVQAAVAMELAKGAVLAIAQHHELTDGSGFPTRVKGENMTMGARILALVNRYDNLCNPSRTAMAMTPHEALSLIFSQFKTRFDSTALSAFIRMMGVYPPGSVVQLIDDRYGMVVSVNSSRPLKPRIIVYEPGVSKHEALILDLEHAPQLGIRRSLKPSALPGAAYDFLAPRQRVSYFFERVVDSQMGGLT